MDESAKGPVCDVRIVVLSQDSSLTWPSDGPGPRMVLAHARSGYEAAAELLAAPTAALVVDLRLLGARHLRLIEIAGDLDVEVFALGTLPIGMTAEDLSGVRLIARRDLPQALRALTGPTPPADRPDVGPAPLDLETTDRVVPAEEAEPVRWAPAKTPTPVVEQAPPVDGDLPSAGPDNGALGAMDLPPAIAKALDGAGRRSKGMKARRSRKRRDNGDSRRGPQQTSAPAQAEAEAEPAPATEQTEGLLTQEELNALLGGGS